MDILVGMLFSFFLRIPSEKKEKKEMRRIRKGKKWEEKYHMFDVIGLESFGTLKDFIVIFQLN